MQCLYNLSQYVQVNVTGPISGLDASSVDLVKFK